MTKAIDFEEYRNDSEKIVKFPKIGTNQAEILLMLLRGEHPTNRQMGRKLDCVSSGSRISELRGKLGWPISHKKIPYRTQEGKDVSYCEYYLEDLQEFHQNPRVKKFIDIQSRQ